MAHVSYRVTGKQGDKSLTRRFRDGKQARSFAKSLKDPVTVYDVRVRINGREVSRTFTRKVEADAWAATTEADKVRGAVVDPKDSRVTVKEYAEKWLAERHDLAATTCALYRHLLDHHIIPILGGIRIGNLSTATVRSWHAAIECEHPTTAAKAYRLLATIMKTAVEDRLINQSPCRVKGAAKEQAPERPVASVAEVHALADAMPAHLRLLVLLAAWCQLRRGELLGLRRQDIDLLRHTVSIAVTRTATLTREVVKKPPKTEAGRRTVAVPANILPDVEHHLATFVGPERDAGVFQDVDNGKLRTAWDRATRRVGRPDLHLHDLRHSGLTWTAAAGATLPELMFRAGHKSPTAALRYQHATRDRDRALADALAGLAPSTTITPTAPPRDERGISRSKSPQRKTKVRDYTPADQHLSPVSEGGLEPPRPCGH